MKHFSLLATVLLLFLVGLSSCEKPSLSEETGTETEEEKGLCHLTFRVTRFEQIPFDQGIDVTRATNVTQVCTRISLALFKDGVKVKNIHQNNKDAKFGKIDVAIPQGTYQVVAIAHSGKGSATITSAEEVSFPNNKLTDTFYACQEVTVGGNQTYSLEMKRAVAMFRLVVADAIPNDVKSMRLYYTGGSSTLNAVTGFGAKNSRQTEDRAVDEALRSGNATFEVYTFPHSRTDALKMKVSALGSSGDAIVERSFEEVPVTVNEITLYKGTFFQGSSPAEANGFSFTVSDKWTQRDYPY